MTTYLAKQNPIYTFDQHHQPVLTVHSGETVTIETYDCFKNQLISPTDRVDKLNWDQVNPATGPIYVEDACAGDILKVTIDRIKLVDQGVMAVIPNSGVLGDQIKQPMTKIMPIKDDKVIFNERIQFPLRPMIGVIGVAPKGEPIPCGTPDSHGGNMDNTMIAEGATLYLPVQVEGGLFALGDLHAAMGDGEISVTGVEIAGEVTVTLELIKAKSINNPALENDQFISTIASALTLDEAVQQSVQDMVSLLKDKLALDFATLTMLFSAIGQTEICQVVDPLVTARFVLPKWLLQQDHIDFI
ncbi:acetamidase/formamidase family protein [Amphibacillus jilinensis]|uniref:acetamidase/formamidase family protein n=1 Tax=Amphibacillus jilinensis TaxID=1216008 RepID=UPI00030AC56B|nr:acetamidase/formamidase family protein [Amphibacillus jilinensis]